MLPEEISPITPINFFQLGIDSPFLREKKSFPAINSKNMKKYLLPDTTALLAENKFADVAFLASYEGIEIFAKIDIPYTQAYYPDITRGDSVEVFIDTRDVKTASFNTRFCHHFYFLAEAVDGAMKGEITHFRTEDVHPLCDSNELQVKPVNNSKGYQLSIFIPASCLHAYDPDQFSRLGFSYRINRGRRAPQHFSITSSDYPIDQQPSMWASINLLK